MAQELNPWCKKVKKSLIDLNWSVDDLAKAVGFSRTYTSTVINGRLLPNSAVQAISDVLNIPNTAHSED